MPPFSSFLMFFSPFFKFLPFFPLIFFVNSLPSSPGLDPFFLKTNKQRREDKKSKPIRILLQKNLIEPRLIFFFIQNSVTPKNPLVFPCVNKSFYKHFPCCMVACVSTPNLTLVGINANKMTAWWCISIHHLFFPTHMIIIFLNSRNSNKRV